MTGAGFEASRRYGSENNDPIAVRDGRIVTLTNNSGGILGGISNGMPIIARAAVKPTASIALCIVPRVLPVCEAMLAITLADHALRAGFIKLNKA